jgi:DNA-binding response OmpR family regulator
LPSVEEPQRHDAQAAAPPDTTPALAGHETVLIVEDDSLVRSIVRRSLTRHGYNVFEAASAVEARPLLPAQAEHAGISLLTKPFLPDQLTRRVRELLDDSSLSATHVNTH